MAGSGQQAADEVLDLMTISTSESGAEGVCATDPTGFAETAQSQWIGGRLCRSWENPAETSIAFAGRGDSFLSGVAPEPMPVLPGYDTGVAAMVIGVFLIVALNLRHYTTYLKGFAQDLWSVKLRDNLFEDHTVSETKVTISLIMLLCVSEGILLNFAAPVRMAGNSSPFVSTGVLTLCAAVYYILQLCGYYAVGYVFTGDISTSIWLRGFNSSQVLLGLFLWVPALVVLFNPVAGKEMLITGAILYILARIIFITKGFRIFYNNIFSLIYFILYLCSLEIIPLLIAARVAQFFNR